MEERHHFKIYKYCPKEMIFDGDMTFAEARRFMDEHADFERRVGFEVFNAAMLRWETYGDSYHGGRKVYDKKGQPYILSPNYRGMRKPESQQWHLWFVRPDGSRLFLQSFGSEQHAIERRDFLTAPYQEGTYIVEPSDIDINNL